MADVITGAGNIQDEPGSSCTVKSLEIHENWNTPKSHNDEGMSKCTEKASRGQD